MAAALMSQSGQAQPTERVHATGLASLGIAAADASHNGQAQPAERVHSEVMTAMLSEKPGRTRCCSASQALTSTVNECASLLRRSSGPLWRSGPLRRHDR